MSMSALKVFRFCGTENTMSTVTSATGVVRKILQMHSGGKPRNAGEGHIKGAQIITSNFSLYYVCCGQYQGVDLSEKSMSGPHVVYLMDYNCSD